MILMNSLLNDLESEKKQKIELENELNQLKNDPGIYLFAFFDYKWLLFIV